MGDGDRWLVPALGEDPPPLGLPAPTLVALAAGPGMAVVGWVVCSEGWGLLCLTGEL